MKNGNIVKLTYLFSSLFQFILDYYNLNKRTKINDYNWLGDWDQRGGGGNESHEEAYYQLEDIETKSESEQLNFYKKKSAFYSLKYNDLMDKQIKINPIIEQLLMYLSTLIGVFFSSSIINYLKTNIFNFSFNFSNLIVAVFISLLIIPYIYKNLDKENKSPPIVKFGAFFQNGVFWNVIIEFLMKTK